MWKSFTATNDLAFGAALTFNQHLFLNLGTHVISHRQATFETRARQETGELLRMRYRAVSLSSVLNQAADRLQCSSEASPSAYTSVICEY